MTITSSKNGRSTCAAGNALERLLVVACSFFRLHFLSYRAPGCKQFSLRITLEQLRLDSVPITFEIRLLQNLANALEDTARGSKFFDLRMDRKAPSRFSASSKSSAPARKTALTSS